jgi:hypothetical protein
MKIVEKSYCGNKEENMKNLLLALCVRIVGIEPERRYSI